MAKKEKKDKLSLSPEEQKKKSFKAKMQLITSCIVVTSVLFLPTTIMLVVGMVPTIVAYLLDRSTRKAKAITVGALNLSGCTPVLLELWGSEHTISASLFITFDPKSIVLMYSMAMVGYMMDWALTGMIASLLYQKGLERRDAIDRRQIELIERWGQEVTGTIPLDERGFPIKQQPE